MMIIREPVVAGSFYNLEREMLKKQINYCFKHELGPKEIFPKKFKVAIVPHAGYEYSGPVAAWVYAKILKSNYILIGPNHTGIGSTFSLMKSGLWKTPLGEVLIDEEFTSKLLQNCKILEQDVLPHKNEHSIEVQLPFLQFRYGSDFTFVPICILNEFADETLLEACRCIGEAIVKTIKTSKKDWIVLASSDFSHYLPYELASEIDSYLINSILKLNVKEFFSRINERSATVCGFGPIAVAMVVAKELKAKKSNLLKYATSGDLTGDLSSVVGYAGITLGD
ncbi:MAG: MEMO1 family protein [Candidatus Aenigmarchaeota archaeon]|nr:MEMO1 family protein [Candidatus Aenigmarchaeota archaeon]